MRNAYRILVGKLEGKQPLRRPMRRAEDNIKMEIVESGYDCVDWVQLGRSGDHWRAPVSSSVISVSIKRGNFFDKLTDC
jgi:hypothetical protein